MPANARACARVTLVCANVRFRRAGRQVGGRHRRRSDPVCQGKLLAALHAAARARGVGGAAGEGVCQVLRLLRRSLWRAARMGVACADGRSRVQSAQGERA
eukprot:6186993-Pleurochrysis_carterae.AAC.1